jgi:HK97 family phage major capsid protein
MNRLQEILARMGVLRSDIETLASVEGDLDDAQRSDWDALNTEWDTLDTERAVLQDRADRLSALRSTNLTHETGDGAAAVSERFNVIVKPSRDEIFDRSGLRVDNPADGGTYRSNALRAIEAWSDDLPEGAKESAERLVSNASRSQRDRDIADHILRTGSDLYFDAWSKYLSNPTGMSLSDAERAALNEGTTTQGGFLVPPMLDPTIILANSGIANPFRQISTVKTITTQTWKGVSSAGVTAEWTAEAAEATDASPTFTQPTITPVRADAYVQASFETIEDTSIVGDLAMLFADARDRLEGTAFAVGTGSTQPYGIVTELQLVTASRTAANTNASLGAVDIFNLDSNLAPRYRQNASFAANKGIQNLLRALATGPSQAQSAFWTDFGGAIPSKLIGYPIYEASGMQSSLSTATASNDDVVVLGDFRSGYYIVDRVGMSVAYNPLVIGSNRRPTGEVGWFAFWRVGARAVNPAAFQMLRV